MSHLCPIYEKVMCKLPDGHPGECKPAQPAPRTTPEAQDVHCCTCGKFLRKLAGTWKHVICDECYEKWVGDAPVAQPHKRTTVSSWGFSESIPVLPPEPKPASSVAQPPCRDFLPSDHAPFTCRTCGVNFVDRALAAPSPAGERDWAFSAAEEIFALFRNASYFGTRNAEHKRQMLEGWAEIIRRNAGSR